ncbi:hypothetical protein [Streptomyces sp. KL116D]|uniref:hypothetical protein n=1 Tax=Streptomyces sp. KL116D TaxID=3045152 RepID=UPI00355698C9
MKLIAKGACNGETLCPAVTQLDNGDYLIVGKLPTREHLDGLSGIEVGIGPDEAVVILPRAVMQDVMPSAGPRVHCGQLISNLFSTRAEECVLPPGHTGSHATDDGARWLPAADPAQGAAVIRLISNKALWNLHVAEGRAEEIQEWVRANNIDPSDVPVDADMTIEDTPDGRVIRYAANLRDAEGGRLLADPAGGVQQEERTVPLVVEPPAGWPVYAAPDTKGMQP